MNVAIFQCYFLANFAHVILFQYEREKTKTFVLERNRDRTTWRSNLPWVWIFAFAWCSTLQGTRGIGGNKKVFLVMGLEDERWDLEGYGVTNKILNWFVIRSALVRCWQVCIIIVLSNPNGFKCDEPYLHRCLIGESGPTLPSENERRTLGWADWVTQEGQLHRFWDMKRGWGGIVLETHDHYMHRLCVMNNRKASVGEYSLDEHSTRNNKYCKWHTHRVDGSRWVYWGTGFMLGWARA